MKTGKKKEHAIVNDERMISIAPLCWDR